MTTNPPRLFAIALALLLVSCDTATPQNYFDRAVLNCNLMHGFAGRGLRRKLESPSIKLSEDRKTQAPMKRKEVIDSDTASIEAAFEKVKKLKETEDTREILQASRALYEYVLPVYKIEYQELARLYDEGAPREQIDALARTIETKYAEGFATRFDQLTAVAKPYAARHSIKVKWDVSTAPAPSS
jgi:hydroxylamine reductase (hybrid-cluster protein)